MRYRLQQLRCKAARWTAIALGLSLAVPAKAVNLLPPGMAGNITGKTGLANTPLQTTIATILYAALSFLGIIFIILIIYGGFIWMTAAGNEEKVTKAQGILRGAIIGLGVVLASYGITVFVFIQLELATGSTQLPG